MTLAIVPPLRLALTVRVCGKLTEIDAPFVGLTTDTVGSVGPTVPPPPPPGAVTETTTAVEVACVPTLSVATAVRV